MLKQVALVTGMSLALAAGQTSAQAVESTTVGCADLEWSDQVLELNPDIAQTCETVYEKDGKLFAKARIEVVRVRGNNLTFRTIHTDGTRGDSRSVTLDPDFRATIAGREYRARELNRGQELNVYLPQDRFALHVEDEDGPGDDDVLDIEEAVAMPETASPLFLFGALGGAFLALGGVFTAVRRRLS